MTKDDIVFLAVAVRSYNGDKTVVGCVFESLEDLRALLPLHADVGLTFEIERTQKVTDTLWVMHATCPDFYFEVHRLALVRSPGGTSGGEGKDGR